MPYQLTFSVDLNRCINCKTCEMSCNEYYGLENKHRRHVVTFENESDTPVHLSMSCNHCSNPVCVSVCPENNFQKRRDGIVIHQANNCQACMRCISACPFHAPKLNPKTNRADKCNLCVERIDQGLMPVCVENCITSALSLMVVNTSETSEIKPFNNESDILIAGYTNPSIFIIKKEKGRTFLREG
ncbi:4Fe-4S dicluster domain-containing protein [Bacillus massiliigorillae]|uniref:4Fe-4S dicluster domain-containing protein n=1 Tax=Bacillus massiliigorillae TaxID=1243664 RepID=UPI0003A9D289|nr:4Fe-4S dicluster domain-containing protein [Bacillus massiliigorillae]